MVFTSKLRAFLTKPVNRIEAVIITAVLAPILAGAAASAATTISTNIQTGGTLSVTGTSTLMGKLGVGTNDPQTDLDIGGKILLNADGYLSVENPFATGYMGSSNSTTYAFGYDTINGSSAGISAFDDEVVLSVHSPSASEGKIHVDNNGSYLSLNAPDDEALFTISQDANNSYLMMDNGNFTGNGYAKLNFPSVEDVGSNHFEYTLPNTSGTIALSNGVKIYRALLTQTGTNAPVATVLENSLGGEVVWSYAGAATYNATLLNAFPSNKTFATAGGSAFASGSGDNPPKLYLNSDDVLEVSANSDDLLNGCPIEILVYP